MFNAIQFLKDYHIQYWEEGKNVSPGWVNIRCIFCEDDSNHLGFNLEKGSVNCWKCGGHSLDYTVSKLLGISKRKAEQLIFEYNEPGVIKTKLRSASLQNVKSVTPPGSSLSKFHKQYLQGRNFKPDLLEKKYQLTGTGMSEFWEGLLFELRVIIPIIYQGQIISFQGRDITDKQTIRYKGCPLDKCVMNYKEVLYGIDNIQGNRIGVVEGILDQWRMGDGFVCSFGSSMTSGQLNLLRNYEHIFFLFDPEREAQEKAKKYACELSALGKNVELIKLQVRDPAELKPEEAEYIKRELRI
jgi:hypothetical protein